MRKPRASSSRPRATCWRIPPTITARTCSIRRCGARPTSSSSACVDQSEVAEVTRVRVAVALAALASASAVAQTQMGVDNPLRTGESQQAAVRVNDAIYLAYGFGNTFLVTTTAGNVVIDTSSVLRAPRAKELLQRANAGPIKYIVLTHAHGDHTGGVPLWKAADTQVIAQKEHYEFVNYQTRLAGFFAERNAAQFNF